jgi:hypothetical protein
MEVLLMVCVEKAACWRDGNITFTLNYTLCNYVSCPLFIGSRRMGLQSSLCWKEVHLNDSCT